MSGDEVLKKAMFYGLKITNLRPRSAQELREKLHDKGFADNVIEEVVAEFSKKGLLNDLKFSKLWVESRMASNPKGETLLREELQKKGVERQVIDNALRDFKSEGSEYEIVKKLADARLAALRGLDLKTAKRRLFGYLRRRGFTFETIMRVIDEAMADRGK
ncbi:MAG: regulatory protein RecX [Candidatus Omnitrophica bacterium]|nr:regulatory protein RecX [Candidatus Omnitrophota bacterium]